MGKKYFNKPPLVVDGILENLHENLETRFRLFCDVFVIIIMITDIDVRFTELENEIFRVERTDFKWYKKRDVNEYSNIRFLWCTIKKKMVINSILKVNECLRSRRNI